MIETMTLPDKMIKKDDKDLRIEELEHQNQNLFNVLCNFAMVNHHHIKD